MTNEHEALYVDAATIMKDWGCSKRKAYSIIRELSKQMKSETPKLLLIPGKINRIYYEEVCMKR